MKTLAENFAQYPEAKDMKDLGFNDEQTTCFGSFINEKLCLGFFHPTHCTEDTILAPTYSQAFDFFREKYDISSFTKRDFKDAELRGYYYGIEGTKEDFYSKTFKTYEEAELESLVKLIEIVKEKK